jgi:hypothetical protein
MKPLETLRCIETITGGRAPLCNLGQRYQIQQQADRAANWGMAIGAGLGLASAGFTPLGVFTTGAGGTAGAVLGNEIGELRGQVEHGCRLAP